MMRLQVSRVSGKELSADCKVRQSWHHFIFNSIMLDIHHIKQILCKRNISQDIFITSLSGLTCGVKLTLQVNVLLLQCGRKESKQNYIRACVCVCVYIGIYVYRYRP